MHLKTEEFRQILPRLETSRVFSDGLLELLDALYSLCLRGKIPSRNWTFFRCLLGIRRAHLSS